VVAFRPESPAIADDVCGIVVIRARNSRASAVLDWPCARLLAFELRRVFMTYRPAC
jgi:hypothetical protein